MNLFRERESKIGGVITEAVGGAGVTDVIRVDDDENSRSAEKEAYLSGVGAEARSIVPKYKLTVLQAANIKHVYVVDVHESPRRDIRWPHSHL